MYTRRWLPIGLLAAALVAAQEVPASLQVTGAAQHTLTLTAVNLAKLPRASAKSSSHGRESVYQDVPLHEVLERAGVPHDNDLGVKALAAC